MSNSSGPQEHVRPYVYEDVFSKSLHFSVHEIQSRMRRVQPDALDLRYTRVMMAFLLFVPRPESIAMIGLGGGSLAKFCYKHLPRTHMDVVEINPHVIALRDEFCIPRDGKRFRVIAADGAQFVRNVVRRYDALLLDGYDYQGLPRQLASSSFYQACRDALQPGGVLVANFPPGTAGVHRALRRIRKVFGETGMLQVQASDEDNLIAFAFRIDQETHCHLRSQIGVMSCPWGMDAEAWEPLMPAFGSVAKAWNDAQAVFRDSNAEVQR